MKKKKKQFSLHFEKHVLSEGIRGRKTTSDWFVSPKLKLDCFLTLHLLSTFDSNGIPAHKRLTILFYKHVKLTIIII